MKRTNNIKRALWLLTLFVILLHVHANAQQECATQFNSQQEKNNWVLRHQQYVNAQANSLLAPTTVNKWIPVAFHLVNLSNGTGGISLLDARLALERCNTAFANTNIRFYECSSDTINADTLYTFDKATDEAALVSTRLVAGAANVFVTNSVISGGVGACGYANFPGTTHPGYANNFLVMAIGCMNSAIQTSLQHEFGHFFDLSHTHETAFGAELVTRSTGANCATAGDRFCDTPADPNLSTIVNSSCQYTGTATDANGVAYTPDTSNIMSYSYKPCRVNWSAQQIAKMNFTVSDAGAADRNSLSCTNCLQLAATNLPDNSGGAYVLDEYYTYGNYFVGKLVMSQITSDINLNTATVTGSNLKLIATTGVTFLPGFDFDATTAQLGELTAIVDPCGGTGNIIAPAGNTQREAVTAAVPVANSYTLYPNPFKNNFTVKLNLTEDAVVSVTIYDMMGKITGRIAQPQHAVKGLKQFDYSSETLTQGMYVCVIEINGKRFTEKMMKF